MAEKPIIDVFAVEHDPPAPEPRALPGATLPGPLDPLALMQAQRELLARSMQDLEQALSAILGSLRQSFGPQDQNHV